MYSKEIDLLINLLSSLQGIGPRSARRIALQLIAKKLNLQNSGYRIIANHGSDAGQEVPHFHFHLLGGEKIGGLK